MQFLSIFARERLGWVWPGGFGWLGGGAFVKVSSAVRLVRYFFMVLESVFYGKALRDRTGQVLTGRTGMIRHVHWPPTEHRN